MPAGISSLPYSIIQEAKLDSRFLKITHNVKRENLHKKYKASNLKYPYPIYFFFKWGIKRYKSWKIISGLTSWNSSKQKTIMSTNYKKQAKKMFLTIHPPYRATLKTQLHSIILGRGPGWKWEIVTPKFEHQIFLSKLYWKLCFSMEKHVFVEILEFCIKLVNRVATENGIIVKVKVTDGMH